MNLSNATSVEQPAVKRSRRWGWRWGLAVLTALAALVWLGHPFVLRFAGRSLIHVDEFESVDTLIVLDGEAGYELAAQELVSGRASSLLLYDRPLSRVVTMGVLPSHLELSRKLAARLNIPEQSIIELQEPIEQIDDVLKLASDRQRRGERVAVIVTEWRSAIVRKKLLSLSNGDDALRPRIFGLSDPEVNPETWWHTRHGIRLVCDQWMRRAASWFTGLEPPFVVRDREDFRRAAVAE